MALTAYLRVGHRDHPCAAIACAIGICTACQTLFVLALIDPSLRSLADLRVDAGFTKRSALRWASLDD